ncbi:hypothetical protein, partial [Modestobacter italicus]|uniref:hypothetical protein n=1 Tax=Modestobacter italicus (strain DSM 44449 / CECT 9708 / BC 501) TaxID=2732864 RepID=UPI001C94E887
EQVLKALKNIEANSKHIEANSQLLSTHSQAIAKLETQVGQIAATLSRREEGRLPSQPINNPRGVHLAESSSSQDSQFFDDVKAVTTLRNGKVVDNRVGDKVIEDEGVSRASLSEKVNEKKKSENEKGKNIVSEPKRDNFPSNSDDPVASYVPKAPFPSALVAPVRGKKKGASLSEMLEVFKQVHINLPLLDAI